LEHAKVLAKSTDKTKLFKAYNDCKSLYLDSLVSGNLSIRRGALECIVASADKLRIEVGKYRKELASLKPVAKKLATAKPKKAVSKVKVIKRHHLKSARWDGAELVLEFSEPLKNHQVNYFKLIDKKQKSYRYIFDIDSSMQQQTHPLTHAQIKRIKIAQHTTTRLRLVLENDSSLPIRFRLRQNRLIITPGVKEVVAPKPVYTAAPDTSSKVIVIDPGHGGRDSGAVGYKKYREKMVTLQIATELSKILKANGYKVYMTRTGDTYLKLRKRTEVANRKNADMFISIHANAIARKKDYEKVYGIETYFLSPARSERAENVAALENSAEIEDMNHYGKESFLNFLNREKIIASNKLAIDLQQGALRVLRKHYSKVRDGGVRKGPFWVLVGAQMPAVLVEVGFITNTMEAKRIANRTYQKYFAQGLAEGIDRYFAKNP